MKFDQHEIDLRVPCPTCAAEPGENCRGICHDDGTPAPEFVCFRRRCAAVIRDENQKMN